MREDPFIRLCLKTIRRRRLLAGRESVLAAVSGGRDSMALLHVLREIAPRLDLTVFVGHVDHGLRDESSCDADFVVTRARELGIAAEVVRLDGAKLRAARGGVEQAARMARYEALRKIAARFDASRIATGHHREDQAVTVLHRALRGAGRRGLAGILPDADGIIRPLLDADRADIEAFIVRRGIPYVDDATNDETVFTRNRLRRETLPACEAAMPGATGALARLADISRLEAQALAEATAEDYARLVLEEGGDLIIGAAPAKELSEGRRILLLRSVIEKARGAIPTLAEVRRADDVLRSSDPSATAPVGKGCIVRREYNRLVIEATGRRHPLVGEQPLPVPGMIVMDGIGAMETRLGDPGASLIERGPHCALLRPDAFQGALIIRAPRPGDRVETSGGTAKLSDLFINRKIPARKRARIPVICDDEGIVWVVGFPPARRAAHLLDDGPVLCVEFRAI